MFTFDDWHLSYDGQVLAMQHDNKSRQIIVQGTFPAGYTWAMEVQVGTAWDAIVLSPVSGGLAALLTQDNLAYAGWYEMQLRGAQGDVVRRTNIIRVHVPRSLSGTGQWPTVPSEFIQIEQRIADLNAHPSKPGVNGYWMVWDPDAQEYRESDIPLPDVSVGPAGPAATVEVAETITGAPGSDASVENLGTKNAALLRFTIPSGPAGPAGTTPQISVTVTTLPAGQDVTVQVSGPAEAPTIAFGIPQGEPGERGSQGLQGIQGWGLSGAALDEDGALVLTIRNPADGQTQTLPPVPIDNSAALQAVAAAIAAQGTTQVQRVEEAGDDAVGAVSTAKDAALEAVGQAQTTATGAVSSAQTTAVQAVQDAQGTATTAIGQAQADAVGAVDAAKTDALESVGALVQQAEDAAIRQPVISAHDTWMIWDAESGQYVDTGLYAGGQAPYIGEDGYWYVGDVKTDTLAQGPAGPAGAGVPPTDTAQAGDVPTWDGQNVVWAPPSGGGKNWVLLYNNTINISDYVQAAQDVLLQSCEGITEIHGIFATSEISGTINGESSNANVGIAIGNCRISYGRLFNTDANSRGLFSILNDLEYSYWYKVSSSNLSMEYNSANQVGGNCKKPKNPDYDHIILQCLAANYAFKGSVELIIYGR